MNPNAIYISVDSVGYWDKRKRFTKMVLGEVFCDGRYANMKRLKDRSEWGYWFEEDLMEVPAKEAEDELAG